MAPEAAAAGSSRVTSGTVWVLRLFDLGAGIDLDAARRIVDARAPRRGEATLRGLERGPGGVVLAAPPLDVDVDTGTWEGLAGRATARLFDLGVVSVRFALPLARGTTVDELVSLAARIEASDAFGRAAREIADRLASELGPAVTLAHRVDLVEDFTLFALTGVDGASTAALALDAIGPARLLLAEPTRELDAQVSSAMRSRALHHYREDAVVLDYATGLAIDPEGARDVLEVIEVANAQSLELRYYDGVLGRELAAIWSASRVAPSGGSLLRSPYAGIGRRTARLFVEMADLHDRIEGALTLVGDAYAARVYREARTRLRLAELSANVLENLATLGRVSEILERQVAERRMLVLEVAIVVLIVFELVAGLVRS